MREPIVKRTYSPNQRLIDELEIKSSEIYTLLKEIIEKNPSFTKDAQKPIDSLEQLIKVINTSNIDEISELVESILD